MKEKLSRRCFLWAGMAAGLGVAAIRSMGSLVQARQVALPELQCDLPIKQQPADFLLVNRTFHAATTSRLYIYRAELSSWQPVTLS